MPQELRPLYYCLSGHEAIAVKGYEDFIAATLISGTRGTGHRVRYSKVGRRFYVSTVFLAIDHSRSIHKGPLVFESMVFRRTKKGRETVDMERYQTWKEAEIGHQRLVKLWTLKSTWEAYNVG